VLQHTPVQTFHMQERKRRYRSGGFFLRVGLLTFLLLVPLLFPSFKTVDLALKIVIFSVLVASFDILLGYTGILSFGHAMFFGIGAYSVGLLMGKFGTPSYQNLIIAFAVAVLSSSIIALLISFISLRVKAIFFAMVTLAIGELAIILATKLTGLTGGEDGISLSMPGIFSVGFSLGPIFGVEITGRVISYYFIILLSTGLFLLMLRFIHSPLGRVLQAIRDNEQRAEALGYRTFIFQTISICFGSVLASITGALYAMWVGYMNPESCLGVITIMLEVLLMVIIGGMGTLYGAIVGAAFLKITQTYLPDLQGVTRDLFPNADVLHNAMERWLLILGVLFILVVFFFPRGVIGTVREFQARRQARVAPLAKES
jgi:branched-chain amino acid transport system permease protein